jgi:hypothetical protein
VIPLGLTFTDFVDGLWDCHLNLRTIFDFFYDLKSKRKSKLFPPTFLFPLKKSSKRKLVAVFSSIHSTFEIVTNTVISDELPFGTHISMRFILSEN